MDVHARYRTESHQDAVGRFNERFLLSLGGCVGCLVCDDELNVLPLSAGKDVVRKCYCLFVLVVDAILLTNC